MPRHNSVTRAGHMVVVSIDMVEHRMTEPAFIEFMEAALNTMQGLVASKRHDAQPQGLDLTLTFTCPTCNAPPGLPCMTGDVSEARGSAARVLQEPHARRRELANAGAPAFHMAHRVPCPTCGAAASEPCRTQTAGKPTMLPHTRRIQRAEREAR